MSQISYWPDSAGDAVFTVRSPATNTDRTLTLPDADGELVLADASGMPLADGVPIVESGSNSDGEWTRLADGTQLCSRKVSLPSGTTNQSSNYPIPFVGFVTAVEPNIYITYGGFGNGNPILPNSDVYSDSGGSFIIGTIDDSFDRTYFINAVGRWK